MASLSRTLMIPFDRPPHCVTALCGDLAAHFGGAHQKWGLGTLPETGECEICIFSVFFFELTFRSLIFGGGSNNANV